MPVDVRLGRLDAEILMHARQLLHAAIKKDEVVHQFEQIGRLKMELEWVKKKAASFG